jgi:hypothetical protein
MQKNSTTPLFQPRPNPHALILKIFMKITGKIFPATLTLLLPSPRAATTTSAAK